MGFENQNNNGSDQYILQQILAIQRNVCYTVNDNKLQTLKNSIGGTVRLTNVINECKRFTYFKEIGE